MSRAADAGEHAYAPLGHGLAFADLYRRDGLLRVDAAFLAALREHDPALAARLDEARRAPDATDPANGSDLLLALAPHLERFVSALFGIDEAVADLRAATEAAEPFFRVKWKFVRRQAALRIAPEDVADLDADALRARLLAWFDESPADGSAPAAESGLAPDAAGLAFERAFAAAVTRWQAAGAEAAERLDAAARYAAWAVHTRDGRDRHGHGRLFRLPQPADPFALPPRVVSTAVPTPVSTTDPGVVRHAVRSGHERPRDGFDLTEPPPPPLAALDEARYCLHCHAQGNDSCSKGLRERTAGAEAPLVFRRSPGGAVLSGCPLQERIGEFLQARTRGLPIAALALIAIDNPMCAATGHRICNDCSKACVYQQQTPVDVPLAETRTLRDVLALPWGFEVYSLLTRWNPLHLRRPLPRPDSGRKVLVAGLGPAGFTLAHHLLQDGHAVVAVDGLKIEPLDARLSGIDAQGRRVPFEPVIDADALFESLDTRAPRGFGGVAEYGITVRWDKNFLTLVRLLLERRDGCALAGGVRLGGTLTLDDAFALGFDHVALATGAGAPTMLDVPGSLARGVRAASDFLMSLQSTGAARADSVANLQVRLPVVVIGGGLTAVDTATEAAAYYVRQVERFLARHEALCARDGEAATRAGWNAEDAAIAGEFIAHGQALRAERETARAEGRAPRFAPLLARWGGVTIACRRRLVDSPAWTLNADEVAHALGEGIAVIEGVAPQRIEVDGHGAASAVVLARTASATASSAPAADGAVLPPSGESPPQVRLPARSVFVAAGTRPNTIVAGEPGNGPLALDGRWYAAVDEVGQAVVPERSPKPATPHVLAGRRDDGRFVSFFGDLHPGWSGSVVRAMASALHGHPVVSRVLAARAPADPRPFAAFADELLGRLRAHVVRVETLAPNIVEVVVHAPQAARNFRPGQFFRLQNFEACTPTVAVAMEPLALTGAWVDADAGLVGTIVLQSGGSSDACARLAPGEPVMLMGPTGTPTEIAAGETVLLVGGGLGNAVLFSIGAAMRAAGSRVLYFAGYRHAADRFRVADLQAAADVVVWCCDEAPGFVPGRPQDRAFVGNVVDALAAWAQGLLGPPSIPLGEVDRVLAIGSDRMMSAVAAARHGVLAPWLRLGHQAIGSVNSPMQCMLKEVCAQCLQPQRDPLTGATRLVFSCHQQDQPLDAVDFPALAQRLAQNRLMEGQAVRWIAACVAARQPQDCGNSSHPCIVQ